MKKILSLLCGSLIFLLMFAAPGNVALAHEGDDDCGCVTEEITGAEKNKMVSNLLKSDELKNAKKVLKDLGYQWNGVGNTEVINNITFGFVMIGIPVKYKDGSIWMAVFFDGVFMGATPPDNHN